MQLKPLYMHLHASKLDLNKRYLIFGIAANLIKREPAVQNPEGQAIVHANIYNYFLINKNSRQNIKKITCFI